MKTASAQKNIRKLSLVELEAFFLELGQPRFRAKQVHDWLWRKHAHSFDDMHNLSKALRSLLVENFTIDLAQIDHQQKSQDGTIKNAIRLFDDTQVESVLIPTKTRSTACVSSQVGCSLDCHFCATATLKRIRNLGAEEIYDQAVLLNWQSIKYYNRPLSNIVFMGMGEPLLNYGNVMQAIDKIISTNGLGMAARRITVSTSGIAKMITKMADQKPRFQLALSLHSAIDTIRSDIMPINKTNNLEQLLKSLQYWYKQTKSRITFEYVVWKGVNDGLKDIEALVRYCKKVPSKVNLIQYNAIGDSRFVQADDVVVQQYRTTLEQNYIVAKIRQSRGQDIDAACGQLANKNTLK